MRRRAATLAWAVAALLLGSCEHAQPFGAADLGPNAPFSTAFPRQLTFDTAGDYLLRVQANDESGEGGGGFQCCWTNTYVNVTVR